MTNSELSKTPEEAVDYMLKELRKTWKDGSKEEQEEVSKILEEQVTSTKRSDNEIRFANEYQERMDDGLEGGVIITDDPVYATDENKEILDLKKRINEFHNHYKGGNKE